MLVFLLESGFSISQLLCFSILISSFLVMKLSVYSWDLWHIVSASSQQSKCKLPASMSVSPWCSPASALSIEMARTCRWLIISRHFCHTWELGRFHSISPLCCTCVFHVIIKCSSFPTEELFKDKLTVSSEQIFEGFSFSKEAID